MAKSEKHEHVQNPDIPTIKNYLTNHSEDIQLIYLEVHKIIVETLPDIEYALDLKDGAMGYGIRQYGYDGWGMLGLAPHKAWVNLHFMKGAVLVPFDFSAILSGGGKQLRHIRFDSLKTVESLMQPMVTLLHQAKIMGTDESGL